MLLSTLAFAVMNVFLKKVSHLPSMEIVLFRCLVSLIICLYILKKANEDWRGSNRKLLLARGIFGTLALFTFFKTLGEMPLGTAVTIQYLSPIFTTIIAVFFLKERVKSIQWLFFTISFAGVFIIKGFDSHISLGSFMFGVSSAMFSGFAYNGGGTPLSVGGCCSRFSFHHFQLGYTINFRMVLHAYDWPVYPDWASATHKSFANGKGCKRYNPELSGCDLCARLQLYHFWRNIPTHSNCRNIFGDDRHSVKFLLPEIRFESGS